jgi:hypothetical protein
LSLVLDDVRTEDVGVALSREGITTPTRMSTPWSLRCCGSRRAGDIAKYDLSGTRNPRVRSSPSANLNLVVHIFRDPPQGCGEWLTCGL